MTGRLAAAALFSTASGHLPIGLRPLPSARVLWVNPRAAIHDPHAARLDGAFASYSEHLLAHCAFTISTEAQAASPLASAVNAQPKQGLADRYGGAGVGSNGGSGRAAAVNGYLVKGIGRTPLVSALTPDTHASGGAYFEETVREVIFSEVVAAEFPHSAVPVLALIDTGLVQHWPPGHGPRAEKRVLLVRPPILRAAHFERAIGYNNGQPHAGVADERRVEQMFRVATELLGRDGLRQAIHEFGNRLAQQVAYSFVHRLPHGSPNTSNIALDGRLLDFGAMSAVPSWADVATMLTRRRFDRLFDTVAGPIQSLAYYFGRYFDTALADGKAVTARIDAARAAFKSTVAVEVLRVCGVARDTAQTFAGADPHHHAWPIAHRLIEHYQRERIEFVDGAPAPLIAWDLAQLWRSSPPKHLIEIKALVLDCTPASSRAAAQHRCMHRSATRPALFREPMKQRLHATLELDAQGPLDQPLALQQFIESEIAAARRDDNT